MPNPAQIAWPRQNDAALSMFYGDPRGRNGQANPAWEANNIVFWKPPYPMFYSDGKRTPFTRGLRIHRKCVETFDAAFTDVLKTLGLAYIQNHRLDLSGGAYNYRIERGGSHLSVHAWGSAIDMDPAHNPFPEKWNSGLGIDMRFAQILIRHGFTWRGANGDIDPMHFQLCNRG